MLQYRILYLREFIALTCEIRSQLHISHTLTAYYHKVCIVSYIHQTFDEAVTSKVISSLWCYVSKSGGFTDEMFSIFAAGTPSVVWWSQCRFGTQHAELRSLALKLLHVPAISAASERNWSAFRFIHTRLRNRLRASRVKKLVYVFENTKPT